MPVRRTWELSSLGFVVVVVTGGGGGDGGGGVFFFTSLRTW